MILKMKGWSPSPVHDFAEASQMYGERRDESGEGVSTFEDGHVFDDKGKKIGRISYNGRIWAPGPWSPNDTPLWDNRN